jgi:hypothetical protein
MWNQSIRRAWGDTSKLFGGWPLVIALLLIPPVGFALHWITSGVAAMMEEVYVWVIYGLSATGTVFAGFFLFNLACAPYRIERDRRTDLDCRLVKAEDRIAKLTHDPRTDAEKNKIYDGPHKNIRVFIENYIWDAVDNLRKIQENIIDEQSFNRELSQFAKIGVNRSYAIEPFHRGLHLLSGMSGSPPEFILFDNMIKAVDGIEKNYWIFAKQANDLASSLNFDVRNHPETSSAWSNWRDAHSKLVAAYEPIKQNSRMKTSDGRISLFRPSVTRESRWGRLVPLSDVCAESQFLLPQDTGLRMQPRTRPG